MTRKHVKYGWHRDVPDHRDMMYSFQRPTVLPLMVDLRSQMPAVYNQGELGSCTANAIGALLQYNEIIQGKQDISSPSRLFIYYNERVLNKTVDSDSGAQLRDGIKSLNTWGFCSESIWPYDITKFKDKPDQISYDVAIKEKVEKYERVPQTLSGIKSALSNGHPIAFGITIYESFERYSVSQTGIIPMPRDTETCLGGHAILMVGYDDAKQVFIVRNSWGDSWGDKGYFYLPYAYAIDQNLAADFWTVTLIP